MITKRIDLEEEFINPNINYQVLMSKIKNRILDLETDISVIQDPKVKGFAEQEMIALRNRYFDLLKIDLELQHMMLLHPEIYSKERGDEMDETI